MTGYIKAFKPEMKIKDYEMYKGVYCSVCKALGRLYSPLAQLLLSFDFTFLSILRMALVPECCKFTSGRCPYNPVKKCLKCSDSTETNRSADIVIIISYYKLKDNIADSVFFKSLLYRCLMPIAKIMHRKAALRQPFLEKAVAGAMAEQNKIEKRNEQSFDIAADPSAKGLAAVFSQGYYGDNKQQLWRFGYMLGRWVYLIDAIDDLQKDIKTDSYNPFRYKFKTQEEASSKEFRTFAEQMLNVTAGEAVNILKDIKLYRFNDIIENIVYDGLYNVQETVLDRRCGEK